MSVPAVHTYPPTPCPAVPLKKYGFVLVLRIIALPCAHTKKEREGEAKSLHMHALYVNTRCDSGEYRAVGVGVGSECRVWGRV